MSNVSPFTPASPEPLSARDLQVISQDIYQSYAPTFSISRTRLSTQELLDISVEISRDYAPSPDSQDNELLLLGVDPGHAYAYWNIASNSMSQALLTMVEHPLILRLYSDVSTDTHVQKTETLFDIPIHAAQSYQALTLPCLAGAKGETIYHGVIGLHSANDELIPIMCSKPLAYSHGNSDYNDNSAHCHSSPICARTALALA